MNRRPRLKPLVWALIITGIAAALRIANVFFQLDSPIFQTPVSDEVEHYSLAVKLAAGDWLGRDVGPYFRPQLFAYVCALLFKIFGTSFHVTHALNVICDIAAVPIWFAVARRAFPRRAAIMGALCIALHWTFVHFSATGYMESFAMFLNAVLLLAIANVGLFVKRGNGKRKWLWLCVAGVFAGLSILTRPTVMLIMPGIAVLVVLIHHAKHHSYKAGCVAAAVLAAITVLTISPNAIRHWMMFKLWAPMGTASELAFHMGNNRDGWSWERASPGIEFNAYQMYPMAEGGLASNAIPEVRRFWKERNGAYMREEPLRFAKGILLKLMQVLSAKEVHCTNDFLYTIGRSPVLKALPGLAIFEPLAFAGAWALVAGFFSRFRRKDNRSRLNDVQLWTGVLLLGWGLVYLCGVALFLAVSRHRLPAIPPLLLLAGFGLSQLHHAWSRRGRLLPLVAALVVGIVASHLPVIPGAYTIHEKWWTQVNLGVAYRKLGRATESVDALRVGTELLPDKIETWRQLAISVDAMKEHNQAVAAQQQALKLFRKQYPKYYMIEAQLLEDLARYESQAGQHDAAIATARELVALVPDSPQSHHTLSLALKFAGRAEEAAAELHRSQQLQRP